MNPKLLLCWFVLVGCSSTPFKGEPTPAVEQLPLNSEKTPHLSYQEEPEVHSDFNFFLYFGPGLYRTTAYIGLLKTLEKRGLIASALIGEEYGLLIAALYASLENANQLEWLFFKYLKKKQDQHPLSASGKADLKAFFQPYLIPEKMLKKKIPFTHFEEFFKQVTQPPNEFERPWEKDLFHLNASITVLDTIENLTDPRTLFHYRKFSLKTYQKGPFFGIHTSISLDNIPLYSLKEMAEAIHQGEQAGEEFSELLLKAKKGARL